MKIAVVYGTAHQGITYEITQQVLKQLSYEKQNLKEFFLPRDFEAFCLGCGTCFRSEGDSPQQVCPHYERLRPIVQALEEADLMIFASPVYVFHVTGQMKAFLDHFGSRWMVHRPSAAMFRKCALLVTAAAGAGMKQTLRDFRDSMDYWGVGQVIPYGKQVRALKPDEIPEQIKERIAKDTVKLAARCHKAVKAKKTRLRVKWLFAKIRILQKIGINPIDQNYWKTKGWLEKERPWSSNIW